MGAKAYIIKNSTYIWIALYLKSLQIKKYELIQYFINRP